MTISIERLEKKVTSLNSEIRFVQKANQKLFRKHETENEVAGRNVGNLLKAVLRVFLKSQYLSLELRQTDNWKRVIKAGLMQWASDTKLKLTFGLIFWKWLWCWWWKLCYFLNLFFLMSVGTYKYLLRTESIVLPRPGKVHFERVNWAAIVANKTTEQDALTY